MINSRTFDYVACEAYAHTYDYDEIKAFFAEDDKRQIKIADFVPDNSLLVMGNEDENRKKPNSFLLSSVFDAMLDECA